VEGVGPGGRPKKTGSEAVEKKNVMLDSCARQMLWTMGNGESQLQMFKGS